MDYSSVANKVDSERLNSPNFLIEIPVFNHDLEKDQDLSLPSPPPFQTRIVKISDKSKQPLLKQQQQPQKDQEKIISPTDETFTNAPALLSALGAYASLERGIYDAAQINTFMKTIWPVKSNELQLSAVKVLLKTRAIILERLKDLRLLDLLTQWLFSAIKLDSVPDDFVSYILELLRVLQLDVDTLRQSKIGRIVRRISKQENVKKQVQDMADKLCQEWISVTSTEKRDSPVDSGDQPPLKKPRIESKVPILSVAPTSKKPASVAKSVDMSAMFGISAEPEKPKKVAQRTPISPIDLDNIIKTNLPPPPIAAIKSESSRFSSVSSLPAERRTDEKKLDKNGRPKKRVSWAPDWQLQKVQFVPSDPEWVESRKSVIPSKGTSIPTTYQDFLTVDGLFDTDREGEAMKSHFEDESPFIAQIEWREPKNVKIPSDFIVTVNSSAAKEQKERESKVLAMVYFEDAYIPSSPSEPDDAPIDSSHKPKPFPLLFHQVAAPTAQAVPSNSISALPLDTNVLNNLLGTFTMPQTINPVMVPQHNPAMMIQPTSYVITPSLSALQNQNLTLAPQFAQNFSQPQFINSSKQNRHGHGWPKSSYGRGRGR